MDDLAPMLDLMDPESGYSANSTKFLREVVFPLIVRHA
jgi:hypothetical protein